MNGDVVWKALPVEADGAPRGNVADAGGASAQIQSIFRYGVLPFPWIFPPPQVNVKRPIAGTGEH